MVPTKKTFDGGEIKATPIPTSVVKQTAPSKKKRKRSKDFFLSGKNSPHVRVSESIGSGAINKRIDRI
jgi:hypothetical protein